MLAWLKIDFKKLYLTRMPLYNHDLYANYQHSTSGSR